MGLDWFSSLLVDKRVTFQDDYPDATAISRQKKSSVMAMMVGTFTALGGFLYGYDTGIINGLLEMEYVKENFASNGKSFAVPERAIITAVLSLGTFCGALIAPILSDRIGRRLTIIIVTTFVFNAGSILQILTSSVVLLCIGRFVSGLGVGVISAVVPLYQSESSPKWVRGAIISTYQWAITWGLLVASAVAQGTRVYLDARSYRIPVGLQFIWASLLSFGMYLLPESPRYYVKRDMLDDAILALSRLRRLPVDDETLVEELIEIKASHDYEASFGKTTILDCFRSGPSRHKQGFRMMVGLLLHAFQQCSGINFIFYYGVNFLAKVGITEPYLFSFITYAVNVVSTIPGIVLVETIGRRKLLIIGGVGMAIANFIVAIVGITTDGVISNKVLIAFLCVFIAFFASSWGPLVWVIVGECYPLAIRQKAVALTASTNWLVNFILSFITPFLVDTGSHTAALENKIFFIWGGFNAFGALFAFLCVYETKGLMLEEIDEMFKSCSSAAKSTKFKSRLHENYLKTNQAAESHPATESKKDYILENISNAHKKDSLSISPTHDDTETSAVFTAGATSQSDAGKVCISPMNFLNHPNNGPPSVKSSSSDDSFDYDSPEFNFGDYAQMHGTQEDQDYRYPHQDHLMAFVNGLDLHNDGDEEGDELEMESDSPSSVQSSISS